jgi:hypothetical protein
VIGRCSRDRRPDLFHVSSITTPASISLAIACVDGARPPRRSIYDRLRGRRSATPAVDLRRPVPLRNASAYGLMPRKPLDDGPIINAERQARHRAALVTAQPVIQYRRAADRRSRARRWSDPVTVLVALQAEYVAWLDALPKTLHEGDSREALQATVELDLYGLTAVVLPRGYGRD